MSRSDALYDLLATARQRHPGSLEDLTVVARARGHRISVGTLTRINGGQYPYAPSKATVLALADLADVPEAEALGLVGLRSDAQIQDSPKSLGDLLERGLTLRGTSLQEAVAAANAHGVPATFGTMQKFRSGPYTAQPTWGTLRALAWIAQVPEEVVFTVAGIPHSLDDVRDAGTLSALIDYARFRHRMSLRGLVAYARANGKTTTLTTISRIYKGHYESKPSPTTLMTLAWLAEVPPAFVFKIAGQPAPPRPLGEDLPEGADYLSPASRQRVIDLARALIMAERAESGS